MAEVTVIFGSRICIYHRQTELLIMHFNAQSVRFRGVYC